MSWVDSILGSFKKLGMVHALSKYRVFDGLRRSILMSKCCWYCKHLEKCQRACINNPLYCTEFCAWFMDEDCEDFEFDERKYRELRAQFTDTALEEADGCGRVDE